MLLTILADINSSHLNWNLQFSANYQICVCLFIKMQSHASFPGLIGVAFAFDFWFALVCIVSIFSGQNNVLKKKYQKIN